MKKKFSTYYIENINENNNIMINNYYSETYNNDNITYENFTQPYFLNNTVKLLRESFTYDILNEDTAADVAEFKNQSSGWLSSINWQNIKDAIGKAIQSVKDFFGNNETVKSAKEGVESGLSAIVNKTSEGVNAVGGKMASLGTEGLSGKIGQLGQFLQQHSTGASYAALASAGLLGTYFLFKKWRKNKGQKATEQDVKKSIELDKMSQKDLGSQATQKIST